MSAGNVARVGTILATVKPIVAEYVRFKGKPLGVTGEVAEYAVAETLGVLRNAIWDLEREWKAGLFRAMVRAMMKPAKKPEMSARELRNGKGWFVLVNWGNWPSEQVGGFPSEEEAQEWIDQDSSHWFRSRFEETSARLLDE